MTGESVRVLLRSALVLFSVFVLHVGVFDGLRIYGRAAELLLVLAVAGGLVGGWWWGLQLGFAAGLLYDLVADTPVGLAAFAYGAVAAVAGLLQGYMVRMWWLVPPFSALGLSLYVLAGEVIGQDHLYTDRFLATLGVVEIWAIALAAPTLWLVRWAWPAPAASSPAPRAPRVPDVDPRR